MKRFVGLRPEGAVELGWKGDAHAGSLVVQDAEQVVDRHQLDGLTSVKIGDRVHRVERLGPHRWRVDGRELDSRVLTELEQRFAGFGAGGEEEQAQHLAVPMPGRVVKVLVGVGQEVQKGQGLVIVEAMKMENELKAPRTAVVAAIRVAEGQGVEKGTVLVDFA